tara:strand:+ start:1039 stop:1233 length:195 start_codon:yes stop_codon:yes gene_type:complete
MSFSQSDLDTLDSAIAKGIKEVKYADREVKYQSISEMLQARAVMVASLGSNTIKGGTPEFTKGV